MSRVRGRRRKTGCAVVVTGAAAIVAACSSSETPSRPSASISRSTFTEDEYGVSSSPRIAGDGTRIAKGGGHLKIGSPYKVAGRWYVPRENPSYDHTGTASWYGDDFHSRRTANGEIFDRYALSAAHPTLPLPSYAYVTNLDNGRVVLVRVNDRGPYVADRIIDLSHAAASALGYVGHGRARVRVTYAGIAPLNGDDRRERQFLAEQQTRSRTAVAYAADDRRPFLTASPPTGDVYAGTPPTPVTGWSPTAYRAATAGRSAPSGPSKPLRFETAAARTSYAPTAYLADNATPPAYAGGPPPALVEPPRPVARPFAMAGSGRAWVDLGTYRDIDMAERLRRQYAGLGPVEVAPIADSHGAGVYRVRVGPMSYADARATATRIAARGVSGVGIVTE